MLLDTSDSATPNSDAAEASLTASRALVDWLSFSVVPPSREGLDWIAHALFSLFAIDHDKWKDTGRGWFGYHHRINLGEFGLLAWGGERQRGTLHVELNAHGCARVENWEAVRDWCESYGARITRCDAAYDDFSGQVVNVAKLLEWYRDGGFTTAGRPPKAKLIDDLESGEGKTFSVGKREHGKFLRGYEKGKQLGRSNDPWFRVETEFHNKGRIVPLDILTDPGRYLRGAYPCLAVLGGAQSRIATQKRAAKMTYERMERWVSDSAGKALNVMMTVHKGDTEAMLRRVLRPGAPKRLIGFNADDYDTMEATS